MPLRIHPTAIIDDSATIADDAIIGAYSTIEAEVQIGPGTVVGSYVTLGERSVVGSQVQIYNYACLGTASQDRKHHGQRSSIEIGDRTIVREFVTVNRATREGGVTRVGSDVLMMAYSHVAHECVVGDGAVLVNGATLGGEVVVEAHAIISGLTCVHQFCRIGRYAIVGANSKVTLDIPPFVLADGHPARPHGPNVVGLRRKGFTDEQIMEIRRIYRELFNRRRTFGENVKHIEADFAGSAMAGSILEFCRSSERGMARPRMKSAEAGEAESHSFEMDAAIL